MNEAMRVAIVHDYLVDAGGAERTLIELHRLFPQAPIFTSVYDPNNTFPELRTCDIRVSPLQRLTASRRRYQYLLPLYPLAFWALRLDRFDLVISSSSAFAKAARKASQAKHLCYCYTPPRFVWQWDDYRKREGLNGVVASAVYALGPYLRRVDLAAARGVDRFLAISVSVQERIRAAYGRDATVVYPPVQVDSFRLSRVQGEYFLIVSRLNRYKRVDLAVRAFNELGLPLRIVGDGPDRARLERMAQPCITFLGRVSQATLQDLYAECQAIILPGEEDFGLTPLEANASGRPVIAYAAGGALETVSEGVTGTFFKQPTPEALALAVIRIGTMSFDPNALRSHALQFDSRVFRDRIGNVIREMWE